MITDYLKFPKILEAFYVYLAYTFQLISLVLKYLAVLFCSLAIVGLLYVHYWRKKTNWRQNFLTLETLNPTLLVFSFRLWVWVLLLNWKLLQHQWLVLFFCYLGIRNVIFNYGNSSSKENNQVKNNTNSLNLLWN
jgi:phosphoglycerol transferase MdoB-like AlkP superfamily enzyme